MAVRNVLLLGAFAIGVIAAPRAQQNAPDSAPQATFKTGVDVIQLDVSVFDKDRHPVRGLTMADFTVLENGKPQPIVAVVPVEVPRAVTPSARWLRDASVDVVSNQHEARRLITIVMDDGNTGLDHGESISARRIADRILDELGPDDLVSVVFTYLGRAQNFTWDRSQIRAAIESFIPHSGSSSSPTMRATPGVDTRPSFAASEPSASLLRPGSLGGSLNSPLGCQLRTGGCLLDTLKNVGAVLETAPPGRKIIMLVSSKGALPVNGELAEVQEMFRALQRANATVYAFDPAGLTVEARTRETDNLWSIADATGGRVVMNTNTPEHHVPEVFRENDTYYLVGFKPAVTRADDQLHRIEVKVNHPGAEIVTRSGYFTAGKKKDDRKPLTALDTALTATLPQTGLPITLGAATFASPGKHEANVILVASLRETNTAGTARKYNFAATAFDLESKSRGTHRQTLTFKARHDELAFEVFSRIAIKPGRYEFRFAAESDGKSGSAVLSVDVPDFVKEDLALSGVLVERTPSAPAVNPRELSTVTSITPTAMRQFAQTDRVKAVVRVYQKGHQPQVPVSMAARIRNEHDQMVFERTETLGASPDYQIELPLPQLAPGYYLLTIEAARGTNRLDREVRFSVR